MDSLGLSDAHVILTARLRSLSETLGLSSTVDRYRGRVKSLTDSLTLDSITTIQRNLIRDIQITGLVLSEALDRFRGLFRPSTANLGINHDEPVKLTTRIRELAHILNLSSDLEKGGTIVRFLSENLAFLGDFSPVRGLNRAVSGALTIASNTAKMASKTRILADSIAFFSLTQQIKEGFGRILSQSLTFSSTLTKETTRLRSISDNLGLTDTYSRLKSLIRGLPTDSISLAVEATKISGKRRSIDEVGPAFDESITNMTTRIRIFNAIITLVATTARITSRTRSFTESKSFSNSAAFIKAGVGVGVLATTVFMKRLTNKFIIKR